MTTPREPVDHSDKPFHIDRGGGADWNKPGLPEAEADAILRRVRREKIQRQERRQAIAEGRYVTIGPDDDIRAAVDVVLDSPKVSPRLANPTEADNAYWELVEAPPTAAELARSKAHWDLMMMPTEDPGPPDNKGLDADLEAAAERAERLQARWEKTVLAILTRHGERRTASIMARLRSAKFRKGTVLWDPPGEVPLEERAPLLYDLEAWDRELADEMTTVLTDLYDEAVADLDLVVEPEESRPDMADFIRRWIGYTLRFHSSLVSSLDLILATTRFIRRPDIEEDVQSYFEATVRVAGERTAAAIATGATNGAQLDAARRSATAVERIWYTSKAGRVRPAHRAMAGTRVPIDSPFLVKDRNGVTYPMEHPGDITAPADLWMGCRCRCLLAPIASADSPSAEPAR